MRPTAIPGFGDRSLSQHTAAANRILPFIPRRRRPPARSLLAFSRCRRCIQSSHCRSSRIYRQRFHVLLFRHSPVSFPPDNTLALASRNACATVNANQFSSRLKGAVSMFDTHQCADLYLLCNRLLEHRPFDPIRKTGKRREETYMHRTVDLCGTSSLQADALQ